MPTRTTTGDTTHIPTAADTVLAEARNARSGRSAKTLIPGAGAPLKQTLLGLTAGTVLADHDNPGAATLHVISGEVRLTAHNDVWLLDAGQLTPIPPARHGLEAVSDAVVLISVAAR